MSNYRDRIKQHLTQLAQDYEEDLQKQISEAKKQEYERTQLAKAKAEKVRKEMLRKEKFNALLSDNLSTAGTDSIIDSDTTRLIGEAVMKRLKSSKTNSSTTEKTKSELPLIIESSKATDLIKTKGDYEKVEVLRTHPSQAYSDLELLSKDQLKGVIEIKEGKKVINMNSPSFRQAVRASKSISK